jgi:hypothetical protein
LEAAPPLLTAAEAAASSSLLLELPEDDRRSESESELPCLREDEPCSLDPVCLANPRSLISPACAAASPAAPVSSPFSWASFAMLLKSLAAASLSEGESLSDPPSPAQYRKGQQTALEIVPRIPRFPKKTGLPTLAWNVVRNMTSSSR